MNLPADLFEKIMDSITIVGREELREADRRSPRLKLSTNVALFPWASPADALSVRIKDLSIGGIGILHSQRMSLDDQFVIRLPQSGSDSVLLMYTVVYWEPLAESLYAIGAQFERVVEEAELNDRQIEVSTPNEGILARITNVVFARVRKIA